MSPRRLSLGFLPLLLIIYCTAILIGPRGAAAQYMYLDTNGDGVHTAADGITATSTFVDVWLQTDRDRDGSAATCQQSQTPLSLLAYEFILRASGPITWGTWTDAMGWTVNLGTGHDATDYYTGRAPQPPVTMPPGLYRLGRLAISGVGATTSLEFVANTGLSLAELTGFGSWCEGHLYDNTLYYGSDWFDVDGAPHGGEDPQPCTSPVPGDAFPTITAPATASGVAGSPVQIEATATDADAGNTLTVTTTGAPSSLALSGGNGLSPVMATLSGVLASTDVGSHAIRWRVDDGECATDSATTLLTVADIDHPPAVQVDPAFTGAEGALISFPVTASDPDGDAIESLAGAPLPSGATFGVNASNTMGTFEWVPNYSQAGVYPMVFTAANRCGPPCVTGTASTTITVTNVNRPPTAAPGGPYVGVVNVPVAFDGSASFDPDGDPITYAWDFGDNISGSGALASHGYVVNGVYTVTLTVSDGTLSSSATTTVTITGILPSFAWTTPPNKVIRLASERPDWCVKLEPVNQSYLNSDVEYSSITLSYGGESISAIAGKSASIEDRDMNGVEELEVCFRREDLQALFAGLPGGAATLDLFVDGSLVTGGNFRAPLTIKVTAMGGTLAAAISPNPLNPSANLTFVTERAGRARVSLHDLQGRLLRQLMDAGSLGAGYHTVLVNGLRAGGGRLPSGVYFFRVETPEGTAVGRVVIAK